MYKTKETRHNARVKMKAKQFKFCRLVQENDGRFRVYWNVIQPDGTTKVKKCRVKDQQDGIQRCKELDAELAQGGIVEERSLDAEDKLMIDRYYKSNPSIGLAEFIRRYMVVAAHPKQSRKVKDLFKEWHKHKLLTAPDKDNLRHTAGRVEAFCKEFGKRIVSTITKDEVETWLYKLDMAEKTRFHYRAAVISFFRWCDLDMSTLKCPRVVRPEPGIYTVDEAAQILHHTRKEQPQLLAPLVIAMFCGVRLSEFQYIEWKELDLSNVDEDGDFYLSAGKTGRRIVHLPSIAKKWLVLCEQSDGLVFDFSKSRKHADRYISEQFRKTLPKHVDAKLNGYRHSYCTYKVTCYGNMAAVADEMGNSVQVIRKHYYRPTKKKEAAQYWELTPDYIDSLELDEAC